MTKGYNKCSAISKKLTKLEKNLTKNNGDGKTTKNLMMAMAI